MVRKAIEIQAREISKSQRERVEWFPVGDSPQGPLAAFRIRALNKDGTIKSTIIAQGIALTSKIKGHRLGNERSLADLGARELGNYVLCSRETAYVYNTKGHHAVVGYYSEKGTISQNPFNDLLDSSKLFDTILLVSGWDNSITDLNGNVLPQAMHINYIDGPLDNKNYNLPKALQILEARDDIMLKANRYYYGNDASEGNKYIQEIEHYNQDEGRTHYIEAVWTPSAEDYIKVLEEYDTKKHYCKAAALFALDILGLSAAKAVECSCCCTCSCQ